MANTSPRIRRRTSVQLMGLAAGGIGPLLTACSQVAPAAPTPTVAAKPANAATPFPTYQAATNRPAPDYASNGSLYEDGYNNYPTNAVRYLAGDAAKDYPNLAAIPTFAWRNSGSVIDGHIYMVPVERYAPGTLLLKNARIYDAEIGANYTPKDADDYKRVLQQLNRPAEGRFATGAYQGVAFNIEYYAAAFGAPNNWKVDSAGKFVRSFETPEYRAAVAYARDLVAAGVYHPNSLTNTSI